MIWGNPFQYFLSTIVWTNNYWVLDSFLTCVTMVYPVVAIRFLSDYCILAVVYRSDIQVHSRRRLLWGVRSLVTESHLSRMNRPFTQSVPHHRELTSSFTESIKFTNTLLCTHVCACTGMFVYSAGSTSPAEFEFITHVHSAQCNQVHSSQPNWICSSDSIICNGGTWPGAG